MLNYLKKTILGSIIQIHDVDSIQEVSWKKIQDAKNEAIGNTAWDQQTQKLLPTFPKCSNFQLHTNDNSKPAVMLQDANIPQDARDRLNHMINTQIACIMSQSTADFGRTNLVEMDLPTTGLPVASKPYTIPLKYKSFVDDEIKFMEDAICISQSISDWSSPICTVKKKPDPSQPNKLQLRMCIDYRKVNQSLITAYNGNNSKVGSTFPLPKIQELLSRLINCKYFSSLDLCSGYYHISLTEEAKEKTAFVIMDSKYQWNVVPFSLATAVSTFLYLMSKVLTSLNHFVFTYLDDIPIFFKSWEEHLQHLNTIFNRFKTACLKIKLSKCQFFKTQLHYLGHKMSADGLELLPEKFDAIKNLAPAKNMDEAHQILGLLGYYQSFAPAFADIAIPITSLLKNSVPLFGHNNVKPCYIT